MRLFVIAALFIAPMLAGCGTGSSAFNPTTWFGRDQPDRLITLGEEPEDPRPLVGQVTDVVIERTVGGVIVRARGVPPTQGYWAAELVQRPIEDGVLTLDFRVIPPVTPAQVGSATTRQVNVAYAISDIGLNKEGVRRIVVRGETNERSVSR